MPLGTKDLMMKRIMYKKGWITMGEKSKFALRKTGNSLLDFSSFSTSFIAFIKFQKTLMALQYSWMCCVCEKTLTLCCIIHKQSVISSIHCSYSTTYIPKHVLNERTESPYSRLNPKKDFSLCSIWIPQMQTLQTNFLIPRSLGNMCCTVFSKWHFLHLVAKPFVHS